MSSQLRLVLDANILLRAVFGVKVLKLLVRYSDSAQFYVPDVCLQDAKRYLPEIAERRTLDEAIVQALLDETMRMVEVVDEGLYAAYEEKALARISSRDRDDWPVVATALLMNAPIWTEDQDFFGVGIATWTSSGVEVYLRGLS